ncbi:hypothetical protein PAPYR_8728 [Paratrimastix pyriformis]|uniref:Uncharacterized protein n=1 Tax=Paratrimastix pyriformis TaxID=342808 RepID=A0ABQ8UA57_9EUKA|nr:hypothetical protein PAPYR_8728 [Paratrimastix pyriformis]
MTRTLYHHFIEKYPPIAIPRQFSENSKKDFLQAELETVYKISLLELNLTPPLGAADFDKSFSFTIRSQRELQEEGRRTAASSFDPAFVPPQHTFFCRFSNSCDPSHIK